MGRQKLIKRLGYLRNLELFNIFFLPACLYFVLSVSETLYRQPYVVSMFSICAILAQGVFYWHMKLQSICKNEVSLPSYAYQAFLYFKWADLLLLTVYTVLLVLGKAASSIDFQVTIWSNFLYIFAILEYVNYYHYQLSHDNKNDIRYLIKHKKIRRSPLWKDMQQNQERSRT